MALTLALSVSADAEPKGAVPKEVVSPVPAARERDDKNAVLSSGRRGGPPVFSSC